MPVEIRISMEDVGPPVRFRIQQGSGETVPLFEIRVTELGDENPHWCVVPQDSFLAEMVDMHILTEEEARQAHPPVFRTDLFDNAASQFGVPVEYFTYGEVPSGMRQEGQLRQLVPGRLYEVRVFGPGLATLDFYA
jgi:hypothetical protein